MITIIYPYRNRDLQRIENSLESLKKQSNTNFEVVFIDYGSDFNIAKKVKKVVTSYTFCEYIYSYHLHQLWNKSRAVNIALKKITSKFCFIADIDMIFSPFFIEHLYQQVLENKTTYFKVGFLTEQETRLKKEFNNYSISFESTKGATGLAVFPTDKLKEIRGYDEFFHCWGSEDSDIQQRFINLELKSEFYTEKILMLHQWHKIYRAGSENELTVDLRIKDIVKLNQYHYNFNKKHKVTKVNTENWGKQITKQEYEQLFHPQIIIEKTSTKTEINYIKQQLNFFKGKTVQFLITEKKASLKEKVKSVVKKKFIPTYSLKEVNDLLLKEILFHYKNHIYSFVINKQRTKIVFTIKL